MVAQGIEQDRGKVKGLLSSGGTDGGIRNVLAITFKEIPSFGNRSLRTLSQSLSRLSLETVLSVRAMVLTAFLKSTNSWTTWAVSAVFT